ncbi:MAG TPA: DUF805 domain-containing protein [Asticcacaulis sp.]|nr:DUF805 domain-containing protein [Asticcacaulis sp.]
MFQPLVKYVDFQGRARRSEFWLWVLFRFILGAVCSSFLLSTMFSGLTWNAQNPEAFQNAFMNNYLRIAPFANIVNLINLGLLIPSIAVGVRRLHDSNRSGFWLLMPYVTFIVGIITVIVFAVIATVSSAQTGGDAHNAQAFLGVAGAFGIFVLVFLIVEIVMLVFFVSDGTAGPNRFGPDPKGRGVNPGVF